MRLSLRSCSFNPVPRHSGGDAAIQKTPPRPVPPGQSRGLLNRITPLMGNVHKYTNPGWPADSPPPAKGLRLLLGWLQGVRHALYPPCPRLRSCPGSCLRSVGPELSGPVRRLSDGESVAASAAHALTRRAVSL